MARLNPEEIKEGLKGLPDWHREGDSIQKVYSFKSFLTAVDFVNRIAEKAEEADHHPDITIKYKRVGMSLSTHSEGGLTIKDLDLAQKIESLAQDEFLN
ncbi:MAG TPA: 4a-hydroxytetrahydrobiopterin dehydratase [Nitrospiria bacterium]|nr:4a-hydroxytetrahydrobiopterin dehydratase [Nitrospiria bacterium]